MSTMKVTVDDVFTLVLHMAYNTGKEMAKCRVKAESCREPVAKDYWIHKRAKMSTEFRELLERIYEDDSYVNPILENMDRAEESEFSGLDW